MNGFKIMTVTELEPLLAGGKVRLVDVRTSAEVARGYIKGAVMLPLHLLPSRVKELDASAPTVFYCQVGGRSAQAASFAVNQGMTDVYNLQGGITAWAQFGGEIAV